ncbi:RNA pseudouridine synthase [Virgibacillus soli]|uniref:RNA pseudouridylate synthase n=1 Tax=Paracerasibacillus soli TaxID=480284 RepID=A0ABU5CV51_9BACI|nr:RNA pseudouridine synthase [Virgibacillus soli]MDY0410259.1 RNA pseudouridine synthase [Virgibacillus soli]
MNITILYEDNHILVVEKPVNVPVQADQSREKDLLTILKEDIKIRYQKPGNVYLGLVHRLDQPVGGAMVFAKTSKAASRISDKLRRQEVYRHYVVVVRGTPKRKQGRLKHYLYKNKRENKVYTTGPGDKKGKEAILDYEVLASREGLSLLRVQLHTGRPHQIRVQLATSGFPIYGDQKYGQKVNQVGQQIALWSYQLAFQHPTKKDLNTYISNPPNMYPWNLWRTEWEKLTL